MEEDYSILIHVNYTIVYYLDLFWKRFKSYENLFSDLSLPEK